jgi:hypothetical protein
MVRSSADSEIQTLSQTRTPFFPASGPATRSFNGLHPKSKFLAFIHSFIHSLGGLVPLDKILATPVAGLKGDNRNIAVLMRAYHGASLEAVWTDGKFVEPVK